MAKFSQEYAEVLALVKVHKYKEADDKLKAHIAEEHTLNAYIPTLVRELHQLQGLVSLMQNYLESWQQSPGFQEEVGTDRNFIA